MTASDHEKHPDRRGQEKNKDNKELAEWQLRGAAQAEAGEAEVLPRGRRDEKPETGDTEGSAVDRFSESADAVPPPEGLIQAAASCIVCVVGLSIAVIFGFVAAGLAVWAIVAAVEREWRVCLIVSLYALLHGALCGACGWLASRFSRRPLSKRSTRSTWRGTARNVVAAVVLVLVFLGLMLFLVARGNP
jgi:cytochrome bd-type quinol oxidase subunit 1